jgi:carbamoyltransferase
MFELFTPASLGYFYAAVTEYLGFSAWRDEGKTMALAPYGTRDDKVANALRRLIEPCNEGYRCGEFGGQLVTDSMQFNPVTACLALEGLLGVPRRDVNQQVMGFFATVACEAQALLESCLLALSKRVLDMSGRRSLCAAGGVFLNCKASAVLRSAVPTNLLYVQPVAGDAGVALGAAVHRAKAHGNKIQPLNHLLLGPDAPSTDGIRNMLDKWAVPYAISKESHAVIATMLLEGNIVFVFDGRAEFGPRALGSRSIIADPRDRKLRDRVNNCVKRRETWRPFGPSILEEHACFVLQDYQANRSLFMVEAFKLKSPWNERVPAVFHEIDGTVRPQTVCKETQPWFYSVIDAFRRETGVPMVLNTSLNDRGDPLVHHPADALRMFVSSSADVLYLSGVIILKEQHRGRYAHFFD